MNTAILPFMFAAALLLICITILLILSPSKQAKGWYTFFLLSALVWLWILAIKPQWAGSLLLFILPLLWLAGSMKVSAPLVSNASQPHQPDDEPRVTQEQLKGSAGTLEALRIYFLLLVIALALLMTVTAALFGTGYFAG
ncbi:MAG TPA: hypothetical protein V6C99_07630 [Oculatellaceae cyanobacterium]|jgi:hypothetical protein